VNLTDDRLYLYRGQTIGLDLLTTMKHTSSERGHLIERAIKRINGECPICYELMIRTASSPCCKFVVCFKCMDKMRKCPICHGIIYADTEPNYY